MKACPPVRFASLFLLILAVAASAAQEPTATEPSPLNKARSLYRSGKFDSAIAAYQSIVASEPKSAAAYAGLARAFLKKEQVASAEDAARKAVAADAKSDDAHVALGEVYFRKAFISEAQLEFVEGLKININNARAFMGRAKIFRADSLNKRAHDFIVRAHELDPSDPDIRRYWLATLSPVEKISELEKYLAAPGDDDPEHRSGLESYLALLKEGQKEPDKRCRLVAKSDKASIPLERFMNGPNMYYGIGMKMAVNGHKTTLQVDTGASGILLTPKIAEKAGVKKLADSKIGGVGNQGMIDSYIGRADSITVGNLEFKNCLVEVSERKTLPDVDGLIGTDFFDHYLVTLDIPETKLRLDPLPKRPDGVSNNAKGPEINLVASDSLANDANPQDRYVAPEMAKFNQVYRFGHILLMPTSVGGSSPRLFLIDTGAYATLISPEAAREVTKVAGDEYTTVNGVSGKVDKVYRADRARIRFSHFQQENQYILAFDLSPISNNIGTEISGALGFTLLHIMKITIDYRDGLVNFELVKTVTPLPVGGFEIPQ